MCNSNAMCGVCKSKNIVEIYAIRKPYEPVKLKMDEYKGVFVEAKKSLISLGPKSKRAVLAMTGDGKLVIQAKSVAFDGAVTVMGKPVLGGGSNAGGGGGGGGVSQGFIDSVESQIKDIQKELGILSKQVTANSKSSLCNKERDILVAKMPAKSTVHQKTGAVKGVKLSDTEINTIRGKFSTSVLKITCGKCTAYVKQNRAFAAKGYTKAKTKLSMCSTSPNGPFKDYGYHGHNLHFGIDCWNLGKSKGIVYEDNNGGGCACHSVGRTSGTLTVMKAKYCNDVKL